MRIARGLDIDDLPGGGVRVRAVDWPFAVWMAVPPLVTGVPLVAWAAVTGHWIELGGGAVFIAFGVVCARLGLAERRDVVVRPGSIRGRTGAWPFGAPVALEWTGETRLEIRPFEVPDGAPDLADRGGDLELVAADARFRLARRTGPDWRAQLSAARDRLAGGLLAPR